MQDNGGGAVHHVVRDEALSRRARRHFEALGYGNLVRYHVGEALQASAGPFDVIFNDIDKERYPAALPAIEGKLRPGGLLIVDNMLWGGADLRRGRPVGGDRGRAGPHARPREPSIVDQLADAGPRWDDRDALGEFNWSSQHLDDEVLRCRNGNGEGQTGRVGLRCVRLVGRR